MNDYQKLYDILVEFDLNRTNLGKLELDNGNELLGIKENGKIKVYYCSMDKSLSLYTLKDCLLIKNWYNQLSSNRRLIFFSDSFNFQDAFEIASHICPRMIHNKR